MRLTDAQMWAFAPSAARGAQGDADMHAGLRDSLAHLAQATASALPDVAAALTGLVTRLDGGARLPSLVFARYYRLVQALLADDPDLARDLARDMAASPDRAASRPILVAGQPDAAGLLALLATDGDPLLDLAPVPDDTAVAFAALLDQGLALMQAALPDLRAEIDAIVHEILLAHAQPGAVMEFDGGSHYQFWGLLLLNPKHHRTRLAVVEVLAHEAAHALLFGLTIDQPLVLNPDDETYASPLRPDPRPMDGIYHATFVSARMAWAMERLAHSPLITPDERAQALAAAQADRANFAAGDGVVRAHGQLSAPGAAILQNARDWIAAPVAVPA